MGKAWSGFTRSFSVLGHLVGPAGKGILVGPKGMKRETTGRPVLLAHPEEIADLRREYNRAWHSWRRREKLLEEVLGFTVLEPVSSKEAPASEEKDGGGGE